MSGVLFCLRGTLNADQIAYLSGDGIRVMQVPTTDGIKQLGGGLPDMTLRQYYAGNAIDAAAAILLAELEAGTVHKGSDHAGHVAKMALELADALITEEGNDG